MRPTPFAYGTAGPYLVSTEDRVVWISCLEDDTCCTYEADATVAGVRTMPQGVLVLDERGLLTLVDVEQGEETTLAACDVAATGLAVAGETWAVLHPDGVCVGRAKQILERIEIPGATCLAFDDHGDLLCVGTQNGEAMLCDLKAKQRRSVLLDEPVTGLSWSRLGWWLITTAKQLTRAQRDLSRLDRLHTPDGPAAGGVVSPDGCLCAFRQGEREVVVVGVNEGMGGRASYPVRKVGEIEFGPFPWLGIGIGKGDCNCVALDDADSILCAPDHPDRARKAWKLTWELDDERVDSERDRLAAAGLLPPDEDDEDFEDEHVDETGSPRSMSAPQDAPDATPPFTLARGEAILLQGGFGGSWGWGWLGIGLFLCVFAIAGPFVRHVVQDGPVALLGGTLVGGIFLVALLATLWPLLRSGSYWLTTHRLHWKPYQGKAVALSVVGLDQNGGRVHPRTSSLTIGGPQPMSLSYISGMERLWGGILLLNELGEIDVPEDNAEPTDAAWFPAKATDGWFVSQQGLAVLRPGYLAFLPMGVPRHAIKALFVAVFEFVLEKVFGVELPKAKVEVPFDRFIPLLLRTRQDDFDTIIWETVQRFDSIHWEEGEATLSEEGLLLRGDRQALVFREGATKVVGVPRREHLPFVASLLPRWTDGQPVPRRQPLRRGLAWAVCLTIPALLFAWGASAMSSAARLDLGEVTPALALDADKVPALSYVTLSGHPDLKHRPQPFPVPRPSMKEKEPKPGSLLLVLEEQPRLILYAQKDHPLNKALQPYAAADSKSLSPGELDALRQVWTVQGRIFDAGQSAAPFLNLPWAAIRQFATTELGTTSDSEIRVLAVGLKPASMAGNAGLVWGLALLVGVPAGVLWLLTLRVALRARG